MSVSFAHSLRRLDGWQQRHVALAIPLAVIKKFLDEAPTGSAFRSRTRASSPSSR
jgi:hypothetical protein